MLTLLRLANRFLSCHIDSQVTQSQIVAMGLACMSNDHENGASSADYSFIGPVSIEYTPSRQGNDAETSTPSACICKCVLL